MVVDKRRGRTLLPSSQPVCEDPRGTGLAAHAQTRLSAVVLRKAAVQISEQA